jgi:hypothetical protein
MDALRGMDVDFCTTGADVIANCIKRLGGVILRSAVDVDLVTTIRNNMDHVYAMHQRLAADDAEARAFFREQSADEVSQLEKGNVGRRLYEAHFGRTASMFAPLADPKLRRVLSLSFAGERYHPADRDILTTVRPPAEAAAQTNLGIPMHTDGSYYNDMLFGLTAWIPLDACGRDAPGLQLVAADHHEVRRYVEFDPSQPAPAEPYYNFHKYRADAFDLESIERHFGAERVVRPVCERGDLILFSNWCLHGTYQHTDMCRTRSAIHVRFEGDAFDPAPPSDVH